MQQPESITNPRVESSENHRNNITRNDGLIQLSRLLRSRSSQNIEDSYDTKIQDQINSFLTIINETEIISTKKFWLENKNKLPDLFMLALRLLNIPPASSSIESFFSVSGFINSNGAQMGDDLLENRTLLKVNIKYIDEYK